jgi:hypothetical protein
LIEEVNSWASAGRARAHLMLNRPREPD